MSFAKQQADATAIGWRPHEIVNSGEVEAELPSPLGQEPARLQLNDEEAVKPHMIEKQVDIEGLAPDLHGNLAANESKATSEF